MKKLTLDDTLSEIEERWNPLEEKEAQPASDTKRPMEWTPVFVALPSVPERRRETFLVTARSANGKHYTDVAAFVNNYWLEWSDGYEPSNESEMDEEGGKHWNGWMQDMLTSCGDEISCQFDGEVIAWMPLPTPSDPSLPKSSTATSVSSPKDSLSPEIVIPALCKAVRRALLSVEAIPSKVLRESELKEIASILEKKDA